MLRKSSKRRSRRYSTKHCSLGSISRKSFIRKSGSKVHASCIKSKSLRSKGKKAKIYLPKLKSGSLTKYGYSVSEPQKSRKRSLKKAIKKYGKSGVIKKLNAVRLLTRNTSPKNSKKYTQDINFVQHI